MITKKRMNFIVVMLVLSAFLFTAFAPPSRVAHAAATNVVTINHYENGKILGTHIVSSAWYAFAIRSGYFGERLDELYHFCMGEEHQNDPRCRHAL